MTLGCISIKLRVPGTKVDSVLFQVSVKRTNYSSPQPLNSRNLTLRGIGNEHTRFQKSQRHLCPTSLRRPWNRQYLDFPPLWRKDAQWTWGGSSLCSLFTSEKGQHVSLLTMHNSDNKNISPYKQMFLTLSSLLWLLSISSCSSAWSLRCLQSQS